MSYDLWFRIRQGRPLEGVVLVEMDEETLNSLEKVGNELRNRGPDVERPESLSRSLHAELLEKLHDARLVVFDFVFASPSVDATQDDRFRDALIKHGRVILGAAMTRDRQGRLVPETPTRALGPDVPIGFVDLDQHASLLGQRSVPLLLRGNPKKPTLAYAVAQRLDLPVSHLTNITEEVLWLNYYGNQRHVRATSVSYQEVIKKPREALTGFTNKIVVVGSRFEVAWPGERVDMFPNPCGGFSSGAEIHATAIANLLQEEWMMCLGLGWQFMIVAGWAITCAGLLVSCRWPRGQLWVLGLALLVGIVSLSVQAIVHVWWPWLLLVGLQTSVVCAATLLLRAIHFHSPVVFLSYRWTHPARENVSEGVGGESQGGEPWVREIWHFLHHKGIEAWFDDRYVATAPVRQMVRDTIVKCSHFALVLTPNVLGRDNEGPTDWVAEELGWALLNRRIIVIMGTRPDLAVEWSEIPQRWFQIWRRLLENEWRERVSPRQLAQDSPVPECTQESWIRSSLEMWRQRLESDSVRLPLHSGREKASCEDLANLCVPRPPPTRGEWRDVFDH